MPATSDNGKDPARRKKDGLNIGFISTRFSGFDGVSLESSKWAEVLWDHKCISYWFAGKLDRAADISMLVPEASFDHPVIQQIGREVFGRSNRSYAVTELIHDMRSRLKDCILHFIDKFSLDLIIAENCLSIPMNVPLGLALTEVIAETGIPTIAHHHDFFWERSRFLVNAVGDYLDMAFPPDLPNITHVTINGPGQRELAFRKGVPSQLIPNVLDFESPLPPEDDYMKDIRANLGIGPQDRMILQPTRVVARKGIEHAIELVQRLGDPRYKLVVSHEAGDEGSEYPEMLKKFAGYHGVNIKFFSHRLKKERAVINGVKNYTLWDIYRQADLITYPSLFEGFGNAFIEGIYFYKPVLVNRYSVYVTDIEPKGFKMLTMDQYLGDETVEQVRRILEDPNARAKMVNYNFELAKKYYSYSVLRRKLKYLIEEFFGVFD